MRARPPLVGLGAELYEVHRPFGVLPDGLCFSPISDVAVLPGRRGARVVVLRRAAPQLIALSLDGAFVQAAELPDLTYGHGLRAAGDGLVVTDLDGHAVLLVGPDLVARGRLADGGGQPRWGAPFNHPADACATPDGGWAVADGYGNSALHLFDARGALTRTVGDPETLSTPHAVCVWNDRLAVADRENHRVALFTLQGDPAGALSGLHKPMALEPLPGGRLLVTDQTPRLSLFGPSGALVGRCRTFGTFGHGVAAAPDGALFVADMIPDGLSRLSPVG